MTRTQMKRGIAMTYGDNEHVLQPRAAVDFLENRLLYVPANENGQAIDNSLLSYADKYDLQHVDESQPLDNKTKAHVLAGAAINQLEGVDGRFHTFSAEALLRMNKEYFGYLMDSEYSQDTNAPTIVARGIEACSIDNDSAFTTTELFESGEYIVDDYPALVEHGLSVRMPGSMAKGIADASSVDITVLPNLTERVALKRDDMQALVNDVETEASSVTQKPEQMQLDFSDAVEQLSMNLDEGLEQ